MTTAHTVASRGGVHAFRTATLRTRGSMRHGALHTDAGDFELEPTDRRRLGVVARAGGRPVATLHPAGARVPGPGGDAVRWRLGRHSGTLTRGDARIEVRAGWPGRPLRVEVTGDWAELDLVVLSACFAVLTRRRQRLLTAIAIAGATGGPH
ncbi:hypothetical protein ACQP2P_28505 [Dactylosporangium sp. CA-139114]|uniref:hypothetical protein n=1 Tax=Dactylosporangium sp. CA-139114 TaxID=3239931 RepID=UPI003D987766